MTHFPSLWWIHCEGPLWPFKVQVCQGLYMQYKGVIVFSNSTLKIIFEVCMDHNDKVQSCHAMNNVIKCHLSTFSGCMLAKFELKIKNCCIYSCKSFQYNRFETNSMPLENTSFSNKSGVHDYVALIFLPAIYIMKKRKFLKVDCSCVLG